MAKVLNTANYFEENYDDVIASYIYEQYKNSPNLLLYMEALMQPLQELQELFVDILNFREVQNAFGASLDTIGEIVGRSRPTYNADDAKFFGFTDVLGTPPIIPILGFGTTSDLSIGGIFRFLKQPSAGLTTVGDNDYRAFIATKIQDNKFDGTINGLLYAIESFLSNPFSSDTYGDQSTEVTTTIPFAFDDATGPEFPDEHAGFGDATDPSVSGGLFGDSTVNNKIYVRITENFDVADRYIQLRFYSKLTTKQKSFLKLNKILPKIAGMRYVYIDDNSEF